MIPTPCCSGRLARSVGVPSLVVLVYMCAALLWWGPVPALAASYDAPEAEGEVEAIAACGHCGRGDSAARFRGLMRCEWLMDQNCGNFGSLYAAYVRSVAEGGDLGIIYESPLRKRYARLETERSERGCALTAASERMRYLPEFWVAYSEWDHTDYAAFRSRIKALQDRYAGNPEAGTFFTRVLAGLDESGTPWGSAGQRPGSVSARQSKTPNQQAGGQPSQSGARQPDAVDSGALRARCSEIRHQCYDYCDSVMPANAAGAEWSSARERCGWSCGDANTACRNGDVAGMHRALCEGRCEGLRNDDGGLMSSSTRDRCRSDCRFAHP